MQYNVVDLCLNLCSCHHLAKESFLLDGILHYDTNIFAEEENIKT